MWRRVLHTGALTLALAPSAWAAQSDDDLDVPAAKAQELSPPPAVPTAAPAPGPLLPPELPPSPAQGVTRPSDPPTQPSPASADEVAALRARLDALESKIERDGALAKAAVAVASPPATSFDASPWSRAWPTGFFVGGYVQGQYQQSQLSQDQLDANGSPLNQNRFLVRRARLRFERGWDFAFATIEVDGNNANGLAFGLRRAEASVLWRGHDQAAPPLAVFTMGLTDIPFGYELFEPNRTRLFLERTTGSRALFPGDSDFGGRVAGAVGFFRYSVGLYDGTPVSDTVPSAAGVDLTSEKDLMARFGAETQPSRALGVSGGLSFARGTGLHEGQTATSSSLQWQDTNANGTVDPGEITGVPGQAATPSKTFSRWTLGVDVQVRLHTPVGLALLYGEAFVATNYDRGLFVADPVETGVDLREIGWYVAYVQQITRYGLAGLRVDSYNPNADATTQRAGSVLPLDQTITTWSPLVGVVLPDRARLVFEYDHVLNHQGLEASGVPTAIREDQWALRLQVQM
jgi:hypothetical protein